MRSAITSYAVRAKTRFTAGVFQSAKKIQRSSSLYRMLQV